MEDHLNLTRSLTNVDELLASRVQVPQGVVYRSFVRETVILNLDSGQYHGVNPTGGRMIEVLETARSIRDAAVTLAQEYGTPQNEVEADLCEFCEALAERGLILIKPA